VTCDARVDLHTAYVAVMRETRELLMRGRTERAVRPPVRPRCAYIAATERVRARTFCHV
jgi:hypothetical protein